MIFSACNKDKGKTVDPPGDRCHIGEPLEDSARTTVDPHVSQKSEHGTEYNSRIRQAFTVGPSEDLGCVTSGSETV